jgi:hypothetical protein
MSASAARSPSCRFALRSTPKLTSYLRKWLSSHRHILRRLDKGPSVSPERIEPDQASVPQPEDKGFFRAIFSQPAVGIADPLTFGALTILLAGVALLASFIPAR